MKPIDRRKPNELSGKIRLKKKKAQGDAPDILHEVSLIGLAANLDDPRYHRAIGKLSIILEELKSINATRTKQLRGSRALRRYIE
ncbi:MAG TPA: hypothetical protein VN957_08450 [Chthoniobacterales bacterium]|nr:hypothetical protein [Chthoniobacterales bacterium]